MRFCRVGFAHHVESSPTYIWLLLVRLRTSIIYKLLDENLRSIQIVFCDEIRFVVNDLKSPHSFAGFTNHITCAARTQRVAITKSS